jgi:hypothetical protein
MRVRSYAFHSHESLQFYGVSCQVALRGKLQEDRQMKHQEPFELAMQLHESLLQKYGTVVGGTDLSRILGYKSTDTLRKAIQNKTLPLAVFSIPGRKGKFAVTMEVANWLIALRNGDALNHVNSAKSETKKFVERLEIGSPSGELSKLTRQDSKFPKPGGGQHD